MSGSRIFVVEVSPTVADDGSTLTYLFATEAWATTPTDTPPNTPVRALLRNAGTVRRELFSGARVTGAITPSYGNIVLANPAPVEGAAGELDAWLDYGISGSRVVVRWGEVGAAYPAAWTTVYIAYAHSMLVDAASITIRLRDRLQLLDKPVISEGFAGTGGIEGTGNVSKKKQFVSSDPGFIAPVLVDANKLIYYVQSTGDGGLRDSWKASAASTVRSWDVFDQGVRLTRSTTNYATAAEMLASAPAAGYVKLWFGEPSTYMPAWTNGPVYFRLGSVPAGDLRIFPQGYATDIDHNLAGGAIGRHSAGSMARRAGVDAASIGADALGVGAQLVDDDSTYLDLLSDVSLAVNGWFGFTRLDVFRSGYLLDPESSSSQYGVLIGSSGEPPASVSLHTFDGAQVNGLRREPPAGMEAPVWKVSYEVGKTWPCDVAGGADPRLRDYLTRAPAWAAFQGVSTSTLLANPGAITASVVVKGRYVQSEIDSAQMAQRYISRYGGRRDFWTFSVPMADDVLALDLHDCVTLQTPRFGLAAGRKHRIVGITLDCAAAVPQIRYTLWGGEAGVWTGGSGGPGTVGWGGGGGGGGGSTAPLQLRNSLGDFTGYMAGSVSTASTTGSGGDGSPGATGGGALGDFTGYMLGTTVSPEDTGDALWDATDQTGTWALTNGDATAQVTGGTSVRSVLGVGGRSTGKRYAEFVFDAGGSFSPMVRHDVGITRQHPVNSGNTGANLGAGYRRGGAVVVEGANVQYPDSFVAGDVISIAADLGTGKVWMAKNGTWTSGDPGAGTGEAGTITTSSTYYPFASSEAGAAMTITLRCLTADFDYAPPSGFSSWATT